MKGVLVNCLYAIYDTATGKFVKYGSKVAWGSTGAAKNAYACHQGQGLGSELFDDQKRYVVVTIDADIGIGYAFLEN